MLNSSNYTIRNTWVCRIEGMQIIPRFGDLEIMDGRIGDFLERKYPELKKAGKDKNVIDAGGRVATVPLINFHEHFYARLAKGLPVGGHMENFTGILDNLWWRMDRILSRDMIITCTRLAVNEAVRHGVTYIFDHHASPGTAPDSLDLIADVLQKNHIRGILCYETSDRNGSDSAKEGLEENARFIRNTKKEDVKGMLGLHAPFTLSDETMAKAGTLTEELSTGIHIHLAEDRHEMTYSQEKFGKSPLERLADHRLLNAKSILAHGVHLGPEDFKRIVSTGSAIAFNPDSNLNNAVGVPVYRAIPREIPILAGTDGMHGNVARSLKQLFLLYRMQGNSFDHAFAWIKKIYFDQLTFVRRWFADFPGLLAEDRADLILWDYVPQTPFSGENFWGHFIYGLLESPVHTVIQNGHPLMISHVLNDHFSTDPAAVFRQGEKLYRQMQQETTEGQGN